VKNDKLGRYRLIRVLGTGGMGVVYEAELVGPHGFRKRVALKVLAAPSEDVEGPIIAEARLGGLVQHPNIVSTLELAESEGRWFMSMELVEGPTASSIVKQAGPLPLRAALDIGAQAAAGLHYLHTLTVDGADRPLVHRDIKPSNLMLDPAGLVKIVDLGIAGFRPPGEATGTPGYMPPEQYEGRTTPQSDLFALGSALYVLLTGTRVFGGGTPAVFRTMKCDQITAEPSFSGPLDALDPALAPILRRCLRHDPASRWGSADELATALRRVGVRVDGASIAEIVREHMGEPDAAPDPTAAPEPAQLLPSLPQGPFVGREAQLKALDAAVAQSAVVSVCGAAGIGKSRLVLEFVHRRLGHRTWVGLSACHSAADVFAAIARAVGVVLPDELDVAWLAEVLDGRSELLVVLDHAESVQDSAWPAMAELFAGCRARWVITRRRSIKGVQARKLSVPPLSDQSAEALFRHTSPQGLDPRELRKALRKLGGMPLSIELAAAGTAADEPRNLLHDLPTLTDIPVAARSTGQREVMAAVRWSWDRLSDEEHDALVQLAVFEGVFSIEDAEAVVRLRSGRWVMEVLHGLLGNRLVLARSERFSLLPSVRSYARSELEGARGHRVRLRHALHFGRLGASQNLARLDMPDGPSAFGMLSEAHDDLLAAYGFALANAPEALAGVATARLALLLYTGPTLEGLDIVEEALDAVHTPESLADLLRLGFVAAVRGGRRDRAREYAMMGRESLFSGSDHGNFLWMQGLIEAPPDRWHWLDRAEAEGERHGDPLLLAKVENSRSVLARQGGDLQASARYEDRALMFAERAGSDSFRALVLQNRGKRRSELGDLEAAAEDYMSALAIHTRSRSATGYVLALLEFGAMRLRQGKLDDAARMLASCEERVRAIGALRAVPKAMYWRGALAWMSDRPASAMLLWQVAMEKSDAAEFLPISAACRTALANGALSEGRSADARALLDSISDQAPAKEKLDALGVRVRLEAAEGRDPSETVRQLEELGETLGSPWAQATVLLAKARRAQMLGLPSDAAEGARAIAEQIGVTPQSPLMRALQHLDLG